MGIKAGAYYKAIEELTYEYSNCWGSALKELLETKHIYQRVTFDFQPSITRLTKSQPHVAAAHEFKNQCEAMLAEPIVAAKEQVSYQDVENGYIDLKPTLLLLNVKLFCTACGCREAFAPVSSSDISADRAGNRDKGFKGVQVFSLAYQCQVCKGTPETFLVRREGMTIVLEGRSPFEHVDVPPQIPKAVAKYYRDALVAMHGGKTLAALFYLRTFLEQFARRVTKIEGRETGEKIMEAYGGSIPPDLRDRIPSMREWYDNLSVAIHGAKEDAELFQSALDAVNQHFDIRRVFKIQETMPQTNHETPKTELSARAIKSS
jgi:hypothetical protein